jgi:hypothetical protein
MSFGLYSSILIIVSGKGSLLLTFGLLNTSTIIKPETVQITTVTGNYFQKKMGILELKISNLLVVKRGTKINNKFRDVVRRNEMQF